MRIERHVFGSRSGYTTLAQSPGVSDSERRLLETFAFGQTNDPRYLNSLAQQPAYISRPLGPRRRAITRVLQGHPDDQGRITLLFPTAVLSTVDWIKTLRGDVWPLMAISALWQWDGREKLNRITLPIDSPAPLAASPEEAGMLLGILSELEREHDAGRSLVLEGTRFDPMAVRAIEMLMPDDVKPEFSSASRSLSANIDVRLNCVARGANVVGAGAMSVRYRPRETGAMSPYAQALFAGGLLRGVVPREVIRSYDEFGQGASGDELADGFEVAEGLPLRLGRTPRRRHTSTRTKLMTAVAAFVVVAATVLGIGLYVKGANREAREALVKEAQSLEEISIEDFLRRGGAQKDSLLADAKELEGKIAKEPQIGSDPLLRLQAWTSRQGAVRDILAEKRRMLSDLVGRLRQLRTPDDATRQLAPARVDAIGNVIKEARLAESKLTASVRGQTVDLAPVCQAGLADLERETERLQADLERRERAYRVFLQKLQRATRTRDPQRAQRLSQEWKTRWLALVQDDPAKTQALARLHQELTGVGGRPERLEAVGKDVLALTERLRAAAREGKGDLTALTRQCRQAVLEAREFPELLARTEDAQRALGAAQERLTPKPKPSPAEAQAQRRIQELCLIAGVAHHVGALAKANPKDPAQWPQSVEAVQEAVKKLQGVSQALGRTVGLIAESGIRAEQNRPRPQPPILHVTYHTVPWDAFVNLNNLLFKAVPPLRQLHTEAENQEATLVNQAKALQGHPMPSGKKKKQDELYRRARAWEQRKRALAADIDAVKKHNGVCNELRDRYIKESTGR